MKTRLIVLFLAALMLMASPVMAFANDCDSIIVKQDGLTKRCQMCDGVLRCPY